MKHVIHINQAELLELAKNQLSKDYPMEFDLVVTSDPIAEPTSSPIDLPPVVNGSKWYPDFGNWVECYMKRPPSLGDKLTVEVLYDSERRSKTYESKAANVESWNWDVVVAYKIV